MFEICSSRAFHPREQRALVSASAVATPGICSSAPDPRPRFALSPPDGSHNYPNGQLSAELNGSKKRKHFHYFELLIGSPTKFKYITINFVFGFQLCLRNAEREKYKEKNYVHIRRELRRNFSRRDRRKIFDLIDVGFLFRRKSRP